MRAILVFASYFAVAFAGVGKLTKQQEAEVAEIYKSICSNNRENGQHGDTPVFCKFPKDAPKEVKGTHEVDAPGAGSTSSQIVFIRPQSNVYKHTVKLTGNSENKQNTSIFVLPAKDEHEIDIKDERNSTSKAEKPHLYYLTKDPIADEQEESPDAPEARRVRPNSNSGPPQNVNADTQVTYSVRQA